MPDATAAPLPGTLARLRREGRLAEARALQQQRLAEEADPRIGFLSWQHAPFWWQPIEGPRVRLVRRGPDDAALVRRCWADADFMARFNRQAVALPADDAALAALLAGEREATVEEHHALHWTVQVGGEGVGFVSLVDVGFRHRRAEFLIGVRPGTSSWAAVEAAHLALRFAAGPMQLERLVAHFYHDNVEAIRAALKLGFEHEGVLRGHIRNTATGRREDLVVTGLLLDQAFAVRTERLRRRLFGI
jgi:RimJ/RimL family protein N-acetyltransferase